jgi:hypothetical protein
MDRQKVLLGVLSGVITLAVLIFVYQQMSKEEPVPMEMSVIKPEQEMPRPIPETIEGVTDEIAAQAVEDEAMFNAEVAAEEAEMQADSETLNNLSESYDENSI